MDNLYVLTGPSGVGNSTISRKIAESLEKSVLIEGDDIYNFFVEGRGRPWLRNTHLDLFWNNCFYLINSYLENGYDVVFNYIIKNSDLQKIKERFKNYNIIFKVLLVNEEVIIRRDKERPLDCKIGERSLALLKDFFNENFEDKYIIDSSNLNSEETIKIVLDQKEKIKKDTIDKKSSSLYIENKIAVNDYKALLNGEGWKTVSNEQHQRSLDNSMYISVGKINNNIVGMARLVGDNNVRGLLCDVVVKEEYRNNGYGEILVKDIMQKVKENLKEDERFLIELCPSNGRRNFYKRCGFKWKPENMDGMYLWIKNEK